MNTHRLFVPLLLASLGCATASPSTTGPGDDASDKASDKTSDAGGRALFDGHSTAGWRVYQKQDIPEGSWIVEDGALTTKGGAGNLITLEKFGDFDLSFEFRISEKGNSGLIYRAGESEKEPYMTGPEYQVIDDSMEDVKPINATASNYGLDAPEKPVSRPAGEWNEGRILIEKGHVEHWLNGERVVQYELGSPEWQAKVAATKFAQWTGFGKEATGHICLQDHGDAVAFRNIKIKTLD